MVTVRPDTCRFGGSEGERVAPGGEAALSSFRSARVSTPRVKRLALPAVAVLCSPGRTANAGCGDGDALGAYVRLTMRITPPA